jgi:hypothetical protein
MESNDCEARNILWTLKSRCADLLDNLLVHQIYSHRHHSQDMDEALFIPHLAVRLVLLENAVLERVHGLVMTSRALILNASLYHELIFASSHLELSEGAGYFLSCWSQPQLNPIRTHSATTFYS